MKKTTRLILLAAIMLAWGSAFSYVNAARQYCHQAITSGTSTIYLSCETPSTGNYRITIESDVAMTNLTAGCYCNINGVGGGQLISLSGYVRSSDGKKITIDIPSSSAPNLYTPLYILMPGEVNFGTWPSDIDWSGTCVASSDVTKPVMGTAVVVGTPGATSANLKLTATDDVTSPVINYVANDATNSITNKALTTDASGNVTVTGLAASISYNLTITAKDAAGNVSANSVIVSFTTASNPVAPVPPARDASTVLGVYTDTYTCASNSFQMWAASSSVPVVTAGNNSMLMTSTNCFGTQFTSAQDVSSMKYLHVDIYPTTVTTMTIGLVAGATGNLVQTLVANQWNSLDISLAALKIAAPTLDLTKALQVGFWGLNGSFYMDNIYFWTDVAPSLVISTATLTIAQPATSTNTFGITTASAWTVSSDQTWLTPSSTSGTGNATITLTATIANSTYFDRTANVTIAGSGTTKTIVVTQSGLLPAPSPVPTVTASKVKSIFSDTYTPAVTVGAFDNWYLMNFYDCTFAVGNNGKKVTSTANGGCGSPTFVTTPLDVSGMTYVHVDVFPTTTLTVSIQLITVGTTTANWVSLGTLTTSQWNSIDVPVSSFTNSEKTDIKQVGFQTTACLGTFYMDNLYFYNGTATGLTSASVENGISCYPNPITNKVTVSAKTEISQIIIRNLLGQSVKTASVNGLEKTIDLSDVASGNYIISLKLANGQFATQKIVKL